MRSTMLLGFLVCCTVPAPLLGEELNVVPKPAEVARGAGRLAIDAEFRVGLTGVIEPRIERGALRMMRRLAQQTGIPLAPKLADDPATATLVVHCERAGEIVQQVGEDESYRLEIAPRQARLTAVTPLGVLRGLETFLQLVEVDAEGFAAPAVTIQDRPRFPWRGILLDSCRHWMPLTVVKRTLDAMAVVKLNTLHWHLSEDQGFRVESKRFPKLHEMGSDGLYYTQSEVREILSRARDRGIRVMPEFDMPGHTTSWFVGYPELASAPGPYKLERAWGIFDPTMDPTKEAVYEFLDQFIGEMAGLFPDAYFHIGGDEVTGKPWDENPRIQAFMKEKRLKDNHDLQAYFNSRVLKIVQKHGKKMIGWDEILHPDLPRDIVVHSWRGQKSVAEAARLGFSGILSFGYYLDHIRSAEFHYGIDPLEGATADMTEEERKRVLGGEACMWSEFVSPENIDSRLWPRAAAIAERLWSPQETKDVDSMYRRLALVSRHLERAGATHRRSYRPMLERLAGPHDPAPLKELADLLEPVKLYERGQTREYRQDTPLNRLVDTARPESLEAREFAALVARLSDNREEIRKRLAEWSTLRARLAPVIESSELLQEAAPLAEDVSALAAAGLQALDYIANQKTAPAGWVKEQLELAERVSKQRGALLIMIVPSIRTLIETAGSRK
jgi:hexosaminidase